MTQAQNNNVTIIDTESVESSLEEILSIINKSCTTIKLINTIDELEDVVDIISNKNNGTLEKITYNIKGFKEPLIRNIDVYDTKSANRFINSINKNKNKKEYLSQLYELSEFREARICASNQNNLDKIIKELQNKGYVSDE